MKWYNIRHFLPVTGQEMFLRAWNSEKLYERHFIGTIGILKDIDLLMNWVMSNDAHHDIKLEDYRVTHFCIIDPVEYKE